MLARQPALRLQKLTIFRIDDGLIDNSQDRFPYFGVLFGVGKNGFTDKRFNPRALLLSFGFFLGFVCGDLGFNFGFAFAESFET